MKTLILMSDNRPISSFIEYTYKINSAYAKKHNFDFCFHEIREIFSPQGKIRHPSWGKILLSKKYLNLYDRVIYIDTDCIFKNQKIHIDDWISNSLDIYGKSVHKTDALIFMNNQPWHFYLPCAGFFISLKQSIPTLDQWFNTINEYADLNHCWEQSILQNNITGYRVINDYMFIEKENQFLRHVGTHESHLRIPYFKKYYENMEKLDARH